MHIKFLKFILSFSITSINPDNDFDNASSYIYNFISSSGVNYYVNADASSSMVITAVSSQSE